MKKIITILSLVLTAFFMAQCTPKAGKAVTASATPAMTTEEARTNFTAAELENGKTIFTGNCAKCHGLKAPESRTPEQWEKVLKRMVPKAKLSEADGRLVKAYVIANAKQG